MIALVLALLFGLRTTLALEFNRPVNLNNFSLRIGVPKAARVYFDIGSQIRTNKAYNITDGSEQHMYKGGLFQVELVDYNPKLGRKYWFSNKFYENENQIKSFSAYNGGYFARTKGGFLYYFKQIRKNKMVVVMSATSISDTKKFIKTIKNIKPDPTREDKYAEEIK